MGRGTISVFLSSTFSDFAKEREMLIDVIPYIDIHVNCAERKGTEGKCLEKSVDDWIDESDMVVFLISAKYGTEFDASISWTQKEFQHALKTKDEKNIFAYVRLIPDSIPLLVDIDVAKKAKLDEFIRMVENKVGNVPRYKLGEYHRLLAMVLRDCERCRARLEEQERQESYDRSF